MHPVSLSIAHNVDSHGCAEGYVVYSRTLCRILYRERCGFVLWHKRLEGTHFAWPRHGDSVVSLSGTQLNFLLDRCDLWRMSPHQRARVDAPGIEKIADQDPHVVG